MPSATSRFTATRGGSPRRRRPPARVGDGRRAPPDGAEAELDTIDGLPSRRGTRTPPRGETRPAHAAGRDPANKSIRRKRAAWIDDVVARKDAAFESIVRGGRLKLRKGALEFLDECLLEDGASVVIIGATASASEEGVLDAVLTAVGPSESSPSRRWDRRSPRRRRPQQKPRRRRITRAASRRGGDRR